MFSHDWLEVGNMQKHLMSIGKAAVLNIAVLLSPLLTEAEQVLCGSDRQNAEVRAAIFNVRDFGAKGDGIAKDTAAVQKAIDAAHAAGGGEVLLPAGIYLSGSIFLKSRVDFHLAQGAVLKGSPDPADYNAADVVPQNAASPRKGDNTSGAHLVLCVGQTDVMMRGPGKIDGNVSAFLRDKDGKHPSSKRQIVWRTSQMIWFVDSQRIRISDLEIADAPYWSCFILNCSHVAVSGCYIHTCRNPHTYNGDGLDIDRCRYVTVSDCRIDTADDCITLRASCGKRLSEPQDCAYITVANCVLSSSCNAIRLGVGEGNIHHAVFSNLVISDTKTAFNYVAAYSPTSRGTDITDIRVSNVLIDALEFCRIHHMHSDVARFDNLYFSDISGKVRKPSRLYAVSKAPFGRIRFRNIDLTEGFEAVNAPDVKAEDGTFCELPLSDAERAKLAAGVDAHTIRLH